MSDEGHRADDLARAMAAARSGGAEKYHAKLAQQNKLFVRDRLRASRLGRRFRRGRPSRQRSGRRPPGRWRRHRRGHDRRPPGRGDGQRSRPSRRGRGEPERSRRSSGSSSSPGSTSTRSSTSSTRPGARITDQVDLFPGRRGAGKIFYNQVQASGRIPQVCCLFGPSAAGGAYIPAFCDVVFMVDGNASMYLGSPRMAEEVIGEKVTLEEMGGARMHCEVSGCGDLLVADDKAAIEAAKGYLSYFGPELQDDAAPSRGPAPRAPRLARRHRPRGREPGLRHVRVHRRARRRSVASSRSSRTSRKELITGFARIDGQRGRDRRQPTRAEGRRPVRRLRRQGGALHLALRRVQHPARVPLRCARVHDRNRGRTAGDHPARRQDDHRRVRGDRAQVLRRRAQGIRRRSLRDGRARDSSPMPRSLCPTARIAVMGPEPAVNAVFFNKIQAIEDPEERAAFVAEKRAEYEEDIDIVHLASENVVDAVVQPDDLRAELVAGLDAAHRTRIGTSPSAGTASHRSDALPTRTRLADERRAPSPIVRLDRPEALNAISGATRRGAGRSVRRRLRRNDDVWVVVLRADGEKAFCVGRGPQGASRRSRSTTSTQTAAQIRGMFAALASGAPTDDRGRLRFRAGWWFRAALSLRPHRRRGRHASSGLPEARVGLLPAGGGTHC